MSTAPKPVTQKYIDFNQVAIVGIVLKIGEQHVTLTLAAARQLKSLLWHNVAS